MLTADTTLVVTVNVAEVLPAATVTLVGTVATDVLLLARVTTAPPVGAAPVRVTVPVDGLPPVTLVGFSDTDEAEIVTGAVTVRVALRVVPLGYVPEIVTCVLLVTATVVTENVAVVCPVGTVTLPAETCATAVLLLDNAMVAPPVGAGPVRVTVPLEAVPPETLAGFSDTELSAIVAVPP